MRLRTMFLSGMLVFPTAGYLAGGWAVVTVENPPERLTVGAPYTIEYSVRQHGKELLSGLRGTIEARAGVDVVRAEAKAIGTGKYSASLTIPKAGSWTITVHSGFGQSKTTMKPVMASVPGVAVTELPAAQRGEQLFAAKGCVTCHVEMKVIPVDVRTNKYDEKFVKQLLADPQAMPKRHSSGVEMPNLNLKPNEISALAAYLARPNSTGTR